MNSNIHIDININISMNMNIDSSESVHLVAHSPKSANDKRPPVLESARFGQKAMNVGQYFSILMYLYKSGVSIDHQRLPQS